MYTKDILIKKVMNDLSDIFSNTEKQNIENFLKCLSVSNIYLNYITKNWLAYSEKQRIYLLEMIVSHNADFHFEIFNVTIWGDKINEKYIISEMRDIDSELFNKVSVIAYRSSVNEEYELDLREIGGKLEVIH